MDSVASDLRYTASHEWVQLLEDGTVRVGITDYAQEQLGDMVYVELPKVEQRYKAGEGCAVVESVKAASDVFCPVLGKVSEVNELLVETPELINQDPYGDGWIFRLKPVDPGELNQLLDAKAYAEVAGHQNGE
ncbi:MAG: glycine cleavage system protein GcvH [Gammaproteobacteria bacterium]|nr:glycine cleavage system protein GcvH [Gammaproteobacteria bacterium]MCI0591238.1 glycine cleavage system protein GcvH [Gammaproteobacteria bacterium]